MKTNNQAGFFLIDKKTSDSFITGEEPWWSFRAGHRSCTVEVNGKKSYTGGDILSEFNRVLKEFAFSKDSKISVGFLSYDLKDIIEEGFQQKHNETLIYFAGYRNYKKIKKYNIYYKLHNKYINYLNFLSLKSASRMPYEIFREKLERIKRYIEEGEVYQVNFSYRNTFDFSGDPLVLYLHLSRISRPAHGFYLDTGTQKILSCSPERFFRIRGNMIETFPIKGTINRGRNRAEDISNRRKLYTSEKDRAEHIMIVDLLRNDLGKICRTGSVNVDGLFSIKSFRTVHHMVSRIYGRLKEDAGFDEIIRAIFPGGSVTGAPKIRAMEIIDELEDYSRGIYTGAIGYILPDGSADFNIAIRTMLIEGDRAYYSVGGGIVYDSEPEKEYEETDVKTEIIHQVMKELESEANMLSERKMAL